MSFAAVLRIKTFAVLYFAETQSIAGDQLARVALSILVFDRTGSGAATAATYAATLLPAIFGGLFLSRIGDHLPRRAVMIGCDLLRAACFVVMSVSTVPLWGVMALLVLAVFISPVFSASEVGYLAVQLDREQYRVATALRLITSQSAQVAGFAVGGAIVAWLGPRHALLVNGATFALSLTLIAVILGVRRAASQMPAGDDADEAARPATPQAATALPTEPLPGAPLPSGTQSPLPVATPPDDDSDRVFDGIWRNSQLRALVTLATLAGFFVVPEGLAVPFGSATGASTTEIGFLLAAGALGGALGAVFIVRFVRPIHRSTVARWMAVGCGLPLVVTAFAQHWPLAIACWLVSGLLAAYLVEVTTVVIQAIPDSQRAHFAGVAGALLLGSQGAGVLVFGALTKLVSPGVSIGIAGAVGSACALALVLGPLRTQSRAGIPSRRHVATHRQEAARRPSPGPGGSTTKGPVRGTATAVPHATPERVARPTVDS